MRTVMKPSHGNASKPPAAVKRVVAEPATSEELPSRRMRGASRGAFVREAIRAAIHEGELKAGQRLRERDVADWLSVSRTPVREGLKMLLSEGLVSEARNDGLLVATLTIDEVRELYRVWADMEALAARYAALNASVSDIRALAEICSRWNERLNPTELLRMNRQFHQAICQAAHNRYLTRALGSIDDCLALLGSNTYTIPGRPAEAGREHQAIVRAISRHDPDAASLAANSHISTAGKLRMSLFGR